LASKRTLYLLELVNARNPHDSPKVPSLHRVCDNAHWLHISCSPCQGRACFICSLMRGPTQTRAVTNRGRFRVGLFPPQHQRFLRPCRLSYNSHWPGFFCPSSRPPVSLVARCIPGIRVLLFLFLAGPNRLLSPGSTLPFRFPIPPLTQQFQLCSAEPSSP
jgi:hypothetical protein